MFLHLRQHQGSHRTACLLATLLLLLLAGWDVRATTFAETENVAVELIAEVEAAAPGEPFRLAVRQKIREGWHTYYANPGDSGAATRLTWQLPPGVEAGPIEWPLPQAIPYFDLMNYGYEGEAFLMSTLRLPADWPVGTPLDVAVTVDWLVCADICIPETVELSTSLPTGAGPALTHPANGWLFEEAAAKLPRPSPWAATFTQADGRLSLALAGDLGGETRIESAYFFPSAPGVIDHAAPQTLEQQEGQLLLSLKPAADIQPLERLEGLLVLSEVLPDGPLRQGLSITAEPGVMAADRAMAGIKATTGVWQAILLAVLGGIILNLMPCVFPVLSMKALHLVRHAGEPGAALQGIVYTAGVLATFLALAAALMGLKAGGAAIGWGFQLQSPVVIALLAYLMLTIGLFLSGAVQLGGGLTGRVMSLGSGLAGMSGTAGSFFTGVLAVIVATPCTAPFMAGAIGFALTRDAGTALAVFAGLGLGLALPFLLLSVSPPLQRLLPRPGAWMERLKELMAFPMYATAAWLVWVLSQQVGSNGLLAALLGAVLLAFGLWLLRLAGPLPRATAALALVAAIGLALLPAGRSAATDGLATQVEEAPADRLAEPFSQARLDALLAEGQPVLVNMTAAWCITCLVNERVALSSDGFAAALKAGNVAYLKGDWTNADPEITAFLERFERSGVPIYVLFPGSGGKPKVLPQLLTESIVLEALGGVVRMAAAAAIVR